ncbi:hypothetical protein AX15_001612 [Amanita polypyramis BW_CC]|nr:hypothetical protein AX15_001612 [Amanita polypyramis BW_CC]
MTLNIHRVVRPKVSPNVQSELLTHLVSILEGVADYQVTFRRLSRKRKRASNGETSSENQEEEMVGAGVGDSETQAKLIVNHLVVGLNAVTKRVEMQVRKRPDSKTIIKDEPATGLPDAKSDLRLIFACRADVDPPLLIDHLPHLVAACNAMQEGSVRLASLPKGAEMTLAKALGVRRVAVIGLDVSKIMTTYQRASNISKDWISCSEWVRALLQINTYFVCGMAFEYQTDARIDSDACKTGEDICTARYEGSKGGKKEREGTGEAAQAYQDKITIKSWTQPHM